jgi:hypothetical protein
LKGIHMIRQFGHTVAFILAVLFSCSWSSESLSQIVYTNEPNIQKDASLAVVSTNSESEAWKIPPRASEEMNSVSNLESLMTFFTTNYSIERTRERKTQHTIILFRLSGATLIKDGRIIQTARVIPSEYHNLRYAAHVPFTVFLMLNPQCGSTLSESVRTNIQHCINLIKQAEPELANTGLNANQLVRQHRLFTNAIIFLENSLTSGTVSELELATYARSASIDMDQNMREAGAAEVNGIHQQLLKWRQQMPDSEWRSVYFIVHGPQQPRGGSAITLYLAALLKDPGDGRGYEGEGDRVVYREDDITPFVPRAPNAWEDDLQLLAAIDLDRVASQAFFSDPDRLSVDIVSDGAREQIRRLDFTALQPIGF